MRQLPLVEGNSEEGTIDNRHSQQLGDDCCGPQWEICMGHHSTTTVHPLAPFSKSTHLGTILPGL